MIHIGKLVFGVYDVIGDLQFYTYHDCYTLLSTSYVSNSSYFIAPLYGAWSARYTNQYSETSYQRPALHNKRFAT